MPRKHRIATSLVVTAFAASFLRQGIGVGWSVCSRLPSITSIHNRRCARLTAGAGAPSTYRSLVDEDEDLDDRSPRSGRNHMVRSRGGQHSSRSNYRRQRQDDYGEDNYNSDFGTMPSSGGQHSSRSNYRRQRQDDDWEDDYDPEFSTRQGRRFQQFGTSRNGVASQRNVRGSSDGNRFAKQGTFGKRSYQGGVMKLPGESDEFDEDESHPDWWSPEKTPEQMARNLRRVVRIPSALTKVIKASRTPTGLFHVIDFALQRTNVNAVHVSASFDTLAKMKQNLTAEDVSSVSMRDLANRAVRLAGRKEIWEREIATICLSTAKMRQHLPVESMPWVEGVVSSLLEVLLEHAQVEPVSNQALSNVIWTIGILELKGNPADTVLKIMEAEALENFAKLSPQDVNMILWGLASAGHQDSQLLQPIATYVINNIPNMTKWTAVNELPIVALAYAKLQWQDPSLFEAIAERLEPWNTRTKLTRWSICALSWAWTEFYKPLAVETEEALEYQEEPPPKAIREFRKVLKQEVKFRKLSPKDIERSSLSKMLS